MSKKPLAARQRIGYRKSRGLSTADGVALIALAVLTLAFFWKIALTNRVLAGLDLFAYFYPYRDFAGEALRAGRLPLWNPYLFMGAPLLANSQVAVLYPLHWPLLWLSAPKQVAWSIVIHIWLAGAGTYLFARWSLHQRPWGAFVAAVIFALGGFLSAQIEHLNQLNASAWLPWLLLCLAGIWNQGRRRWLALLCGGAIVGLALLAGHTQAAYIVLLGAAVYALLRGLAYFGKRNWLAGLRGIAALSAMTLMGLLLAASQLLPTLELTRLSVRSGGLPYNEAASFSLKPGLIFKAFLPPLAWEPPFSEYVAYVGLIGLALVSIGAWAIVRRKRHGGEALGLALTGILLAFGAYNPVYYLLFKLVPGFDLFRAPARWLLLYSFGAAILASIGLETLSTAVSPADTSNDSLVPHPRLGPWPPIIILLLVFELFLAGRRLAYNQPTAPTAFDSMRTAPSHLLADIAYGSDNRLFRFLSMSDIRYDPGDLGDLQAMYQSDLPEDAIYDLIVATKMKEVLAYNLPLRYRLFSVDGYDGGLLPITDYVSLEGLFLTKDEIWPDGRLRQQLRQVPPARLLSLLNVKYVITDKTQDVWIDDVFYDLEHTVPLGEVTLTDLPDFETTQLGIVSYLTGTVDLEQGTPVAEITVTGTAGWEATVLGTSTVTHTITLRAGEHTAEGIYSAGPVAHRQARVGHQWRYNDQGNDYLAVLTLEQPLRPEIITVRSLLPGERFRLRGMTLIDRHTSTNRILSIDPTYKLVHSGDVKIYQNLAVLPRAFVVHQATVLAEDQQVLDLLRDPEFDPSQTVILDHGEELAAVARESRANVISYDPERVQVQVTLDHPGYLVLTDTYYPGWKVTVDGEPAPILRADLYFRAVPLPDGEHKVNFHYQPSSVQLGCSLSLAAWVLWMLVIIVTSICIGRKLTTSV
jgi:hypothetical protein